MSNMGNLLSCRTWPNCCAKEPDHRQTDAGQAGNIIIRKVPELQMPTPIPSSLLSCLVERLELQAVQRELTTLSCMPPRPQCGPATFHDTESCLFYPYQLHCTYPYCQNLKKYPRLYCVPHACAQESCKQAVQVQPSDVSAKSSTGATRSINTKNAASMNIEGTITLSSGSQSAAPGHCFNHQYMI